MSRRPVVILLLSLSIGTWGCEQSDEPIANQVESQEEPQQEPQENEVPGSVAASEFEEELVEGICLSYERCQNEDFQVAVYSVFLQSLAREHPEDEEISRLMQELEIQQVPPREDCTRVFTKAVVGFGMSAEGLQQKIADGRLEYDGDLAGECIARFGLPFDLCSEERPLSAQMEAQDFVEMMSRHEQNMNAHFQSCGEVLQGKVEEGEECEESYECAGGLQCGESEEGAMICRTAQATGGGFLQ